ncbi:MAG: exodeoxyribonuclease III [Methanothrix sp.]|nr:exodeoxyribonuclease III [Methanothrix sp.]
MILRLLSWNVNGLRAIYKKGFVDWLRGDMPDVLCLQETKVTADQVPSELKSIPGYFSYFGSGERKGRDGVALFSKTEPLSVKYTLGMDGFDDEHRAIVADYGEFLLFVVYFPNGKASQERLVEKGFVDTFRIFHAEGENYSWWDLKTRARERNVGWRIDYFFVSENLREAVSSAFILRDVTGADHCPVGIELEIDSSSKEKGFISN